MFFRARGPGPGRTGSRTSPGAKKISICPPTCFLQMSPSRVRHLEPGGRVALVEQREQVVVISLRGCCTWCARRVRRRLPSVAALAVAAAHVGPVRVPARRRAREVVVGRRSAAGPICSPRAGWCTCTPARAPWCRSPWPPCRYPRCRPSPCRRAVVAAAAVEAALAEALRLRACAENAAQSSTAVRTSGGGLHRGGPGSSSGRGVRSRGPALAAHHARPAAICGLAPLRRLPCAATTR